MCPESHATYCLQPGSQLSPAILTCCAPIPWRTVGAPSPARCTRCAPTPPHHAVAHTGPALPAAPAASARWGTCVEQQKDPQVSKRHKAHLVALMAHIAGCHMHQCTCAVNLGSNKAARKRTGHLTSRDLFVTSVPAPHSPGHLAVEVAVHDHAHKATPRMQGVVCHRVVCRAAPEMVAKASVLGHEAVHDAVPTSTSYVRRCCGARHKMKEDEHNVQVSKTKRFVYAGTLNSTLHQAARCSWDVAVQEPLTCSPAAHAARLHQRNPHNLCTQHAAILIESLRGSSGERSSTACHAAASCLLTA